VPTKKTPAPIRRKAKQASSTAPVPFLSPEMSDTFVGLSYQIMEILSEIGEPFVSRTHEKECTLFRVAQPLKKQSQKEKKSERNGNDAIPFWRLPKSAQEPSRALLLRLERRGIPKGKIWKIIAPLDPMREAGFRHHDLMLKDLRKALNDTKKDRQLLKYYAQKDSRMPVPSDLQARLLADCQPVISLVDRHLRKLKKAFGVLGKMKAQIALYKGSRAMQKAQDQLMAIMVDEAGFKPHPASVETHALLQACAPKRAPKTAHSVRSRYYQRRGIKQGQTSM